MWNKRKFHYPCLARLHPICEHTSWDLVLPVRSGIQEAINWMATKNFPRPQKKVAFRSQNSREYYRRQIWHHPLWIRSDAQTVVHRRKFSKSCSYASGVICPSYTGLNCTTIPLPTCYLRYVTVLDPTPYFLHLALADFIYFLALSNSSLLLIFNICWSCLKYYPSSYTIKIQINVSLLKWQYIKTWDY